MTNTFNTTIREFLAPKKLALAGVSRNPKKFGYAALKELKEKGFDVYPVHPEADEILGVKCYHSVSGLPADIRHLVSMVPKDQTRTVVAEALDRGISNIWIQQMSDTPEAIDLAKERNAGLVVKTCILMHASPVKSIHAFHRGLLKIFGMLPK
jgi:hypothetical protein